MIDSVKLRDARRLSEPEFFLKYGEHPAIVIRQDEEDGKDCLGCQ